MRTKRTNNGFKKLHIQYEEFNAYLDQIDEHNKNKEKKIRKHCDSMDNSIGTLRTFNCKINFSFIFPAHGINRVGYSYG